jgi:hypothetical protein
MHALIHVRVYGSSLQRVLMLRCIIQYVQTPLQVSHHTHEGGRLSDTTYTTVML